jgi:hypothetical protein
MDRPGEIGQIWLWDKLEKIACFKKLENISTVFINCLAFLGCIGKASFPKFPKIYGLSINDVMAAGKE